MPDLVLDMLLQVLLLKFVTIVLANPTPVNRRPPPLPSQGSTNVTANNPQIFCQVHGPELSQSQIEECKDAIAFLPMSARDENTFGPYERNRLYRTPISARNGRCEAIVDIRSSISAERSSWEEIKLRGFRKVFQNCLNEKHQVGFARIGRYHNLELLVNYLHYGMDVGD